MAQPTETSVPYGTANVDRTGSSAFAARLLHSDDAPNVVFVSAEPLGYSNVVVETTNARILELIHTFQDDFAGAKANYVGTWRATRGLDMDKVFKKKKGKVFNNFCADVVLFAVARFILFGKYIPIVQMSK